MFPEEVNVEKGMLGLNWVGRDDQERKKRYGINSRVQEKYNTPPGCCPKLLFLTELQQTQNGQRSVLSFKHMGM